MTRTATLFAAALAMATAACATAGARTHPAATHAAAAADTARRITHTAADVEFMQGMLAHHAQALEMTELVSARTRRDDVRLLAERIDVSQRDEMAAMRQWLRARGQDTTGAMHAGHAMPGMATAGEMARLAGFSGPAFDTLFLQLMTRHHEGALAMVARLFTMRGAGQEPAMFDFVSHVDSDQRIEISRMRVMLGTRP
ncbi:MAG TPA: DUF305 domain-containing protein [Longimicrobium sp.]|nr:DUF305 domain-containing protein [Longimicrobium sp.]